VFLSQHPIGPDTVELPSSGRRGALFPDGCWFAALSLTLISVLPARSPLALGPRASRIEKTKAKLARADPENRM
jgi:hypothetical protein